METLWKMRRAGVFDKFYKNVVSDQHEFERAAKEAGSFCITDNVQFIGTAKCTANNIIRQRLVNTSGNKQVYESSTAQNTRLAPIFERGVTCSVCARFFIGIRLD